MYIKYDYKDERGKVPFTESSLSYNTRPVKTTKQKMDKDEQSKWYKKGFMHSSGLMPFYIFLHKKVFGDTLA
jgi:hypothetical protein